MDVWDAEATPNAMFAFGYLEIAGSHPAHF
jgi:hypothetical protein